MTNQRVSVLKRNIRLAMVGAVLAMSMSGEALAEDMVKSVATSGTGIIANATVLTAVKVGLDVGKSQGTAPGPYNQSANTVLANDAVSLGNLPLGAGLLTQSLGATAITSNANSAFNGNLATAGGSGTSSITGLNLSLKAILTLLQVKANVISSTTTFDNSGDTGLLTGTSNITNLQITGLNVLGVSLNVNSNKNNVVLDVLGLVKIITNEQIPVTTSFTQNGKLFETSTLTTNALHIIVSEGLLGGSVVNSNIIVGQSMASYTRAVPETSTWVMFMLGIGALGATMRLRNRAKIRGEGGAMPLALLAA